MIAVIVDTLAIGVSGLISYFIRDNIFHLHQISAGKLLLVVVYSGAFLIGSASVFGLYRASFHPNANHQAAIALKSYFLTVPVVIASFYFLEWYALPRVFTTMFFIAVPVMYALGRILLRKFAKGMRAKGYGIERTLLIDQGEGGPYVFRRYDVLPDLGYDVVCVASWNGSAIPAHRYHNVNVARCETSDDLLQLIRQQAIRRVLVTSTDMHTFSVTDIVQVCKSAGAALKILSQESDELLRFAYVTDIAGIPLYSPSLTRVGTFRRIVKRAFDVVASVLLICTLSPVLLAAALAIVIESGFPVTFQQRRSLTRGGKDFGFYKFRSMVQNAEEMKESLYSQNESDGALFKIKQDPRITKVGRLIRRYSIDELPQLFNVLFGEMSLVGPRPLPAEDFERMNGSTELWMALQGREGVKPGITGLWQISGRSNLGFREMVMLDFYYIENQSIFFDLEILFATIPVVLFGRGAY